MGLNYTEFKDYVSKRELNDFQSLNVVVSNIREFYQEEDFKFFYPRNVFNEKETELLIFLNNSYLSIKKDSNGNWIFDHTNAKIVKKVIIAPRYTNGHHELKILFENGNEVILKNLEDSNNHWVDEYSNAIRELYKVI